MSDLQWPAGQKRTPVHKRESGGQFDVSMSRAFTDLEKDLARMDVDEYRYEFAADARQNDSRPYSRANPDDPGFVLRWTMGGEDFAVACDAYAKLRANVRCVGLYIGEKRMMEKRPVTTTQDEFANARLPSAEDVEPMGPPPHEVLGVAPDAHPSVVKAAAKARTLEAHPDQGGSQEELTRVRQAREDLLGE